MIGCEFWIRSEFGVRRVRSPRVSKGKWPSLTVGLLTRTAAGDTHEYNPETLVQHHQVNAHQHWSASCLRDRLHDSVGDVLPLYLDSRSDCMAGLVHLRFFVL